MEGNEPVSRHVRGKEPAHCTSCTELHLVSVIAPGALICVLYSNQFAIGEECLQTSQDLQKHNMTSDDKPALCHDREDDDKVDNNTEDSLLAEPSTVIEKPSHRTGRRITLK